MTSQRKTVQRYEILKEQVWNILLRDCTDKSQPAKSIVHLTGVAMLGAMIAMKRNLNPEIAQCAGLLHDVWLYVHIPVDAESHRKHGHLGSELAQEILVASDCFEKEEINLITTMIHHHNDKDISHDTYSEVLKDADALQHFLRDSDYDRKYRYEGRIEKILEEFGIAES